MPARRKPNLYRRPRSKFWWCWFYAPDPKRPGNSSKIRKSTRQSDRALAKVAARRIERDYLAAPETEAAQVDELMAMYLASRERIGRAEATMLYYVQKARPVVRYFGERDAHTLSLADAENYIEHRLDGGVKLATIAKELGALRSALRHAKKHGCFRGEPEQVLPDDVRGTYVPRDRALTRPEYVSLRLALTRPSGATRCDG